MIQFSIIVPLYNKANFVKKTVESILAQTYKEFEVIIVNDGSTDNSLAIVSEINDPRIRIFTKENGGVSAARNFGIEKAQHEYVTFLDADDIWLPDYLETIKAMIEQYPQAGIFATTYTLINSLGKKLSRTIDNLPEKNLVLTDHYCRSIIKGEIRSLCTITTCVKKELFNTTGGFRVGIKVGEDLDMWLRLGLISSIVWKNESKALYCLVTENNATSARYSYKDEFPYWEWYAYSSSIYLKMYVTRIIKRHLQDLNLKDKIHYLPKVNWFYFLLDLLYLIYKTAQKQFSKS